MGASVEIVLLENIRALGQVGDVKKVKIGYARNYLVPQNLAAFASKGVINQISKLKKRKEKQLQNFKKDAQAIQKVLDGQSIEMEVAIQESGQLYGSVNTNHVIEAIQKQFNVTVEKQHLIMPNHFKEIGSKTIQIEPHPEVSFKFTINIVSDKPMEIEDKKAPKKARTSLKRAQEKREKGGEAKPATKRAKKEAEAEASSVPSESDAAETEPNE